MTFRAPTSAARAPLTPTETEPVIVPPPGLGKATMNTGSGLDHGAVAAGDLDDRHVRRHHDAALAGGIADLKFAALGPDRHLADGAVGHHRTLAQVPAVVALADLHARRKDMDFEEDRPNALGLGISAVPTKLPVVISVTLIGLVTCTFQSGVRPTLTGLPLLGRTVIWPGWRLVTTPRADLRSRGAPGPWAPAGRGGRAAGPPRRQGRERPVSFAVPHLGHEANALLIKSTQDSAHKQKEGAATALSALDLATDRAAARQIIFKRDKGL